METRQYSDNDIEQLVADNWSKILKILEDHYDVNNVIIQTWIEPLKIYKVEKSTIYFYIPEDRNSYSITYLHNKSYDICLLSSIREFMNDTSIELVIDEKVNYVVTPDEYVVTTGDNHYSAAYYESIKKSNLNPQYTFENFVVGSGNNHAFATCHAVAEMPGQEMFNPLFLYGGSGLGKTHLIQSIAHYILQNNPKLTVLYITSEIFTNEIIEAINKHNTEKFREKYRNIDVLIIDDIQDLIGRESTQNEFFNTFNYLYNQKKQIILSSDKPPKDMKSLEERYRSRFEWGIPIDIHAPDYETRMAILKSKAKMLRIDNIPNEVLKYIAENIVSNIRELEGALKKLYVLTNLSDEKITLELAQATLKDLISKDTEIKVTPELILKNVSEHMNVSIEDLKSNKRNKEIADARHIYMYICRKITDKSLVAIGEVVGGRDHATVFNGIKRVEKKIEENPDMEATINIIITKINPNY